MLFCPVCGNMLLIETKPTYGMRFYCQTCPFIHNVQNRVETGVQNLRTKKVEDVIGGEAWETANATEAVCPKCTHDKAYFYELQTRSADEPMTIFFRCEKCGHQWSQ
uniref:DNA-directed RNA polymerase subunit n=1 Tax=Rhodosorus marinus TaxID=101924 RepID=A0A7S2ZL30_9RHOD|mmetsp:Transcript_23536/g.93199  ORF Transcript_23536/g.93199 Transcript_23536/m.93199 type:complete len:107 (+) Transcript_23536:219-539(+)